jgi:hypothetical protein
MFVFKPLFVTAVQLPLITSFFFCFYDIFSFGSPLRPAAKAQLAALQWQVKKSSGECVFAFVSVFPSFVASGVVFVSLVCFSIIVSR